MSQKSLSAMRNKNGTSYAVSIDTESPGLRQVYEVANSLTQDFKKIRARVLIAERYLKVTLKTTGGMVLETAGLAVFDLSQARECQIVLVAPEQNYLLPYSQHLYTQVTAQGEECRWCGLSESQLCACRAPAFEQDFNAQANACV